MPFTAPVTVLAFALGGAVSFGLGPIFSKRGLADDGTWVQSTLVVVGTRTTIFWAVLIGSGGLSALAEVTPVVGAIFAAAGVVIGVGRFMFYKGVDDVGSTLANAFVNTRPLFAVVLAILWLGESVTPQIGVGVLLLVAGLGALSLSKGGDIAGWDRIDLVLPLVAAMLFAVANVLRRFGFTSSTIGTLEALAVGDLVALLFISAVAVAGTQRNLTASRRTYGYFLLSGLTNATGIFLLFQALSLEGGDVSIVDPLNSTAPLFTTIFAVVLLRDVERVTLGTVVGVVVVIAGIALVTLG